MLLLLATVQHEAGNKPRAEALLTAAAQAARALRDPALQGLLQCAEADLADERWPAARVRDAFAQATAALRQAGDSYALADCLRSQSRQLARRGDAVHARALQEEASRVLSLARKGPSTAPVTSP